MLFIGRDIVIAVIASAPKSFTLSGATTLQHGESLTGITLAQLTRTGSPAF
jgi:trimethylamine:corrinoid methyltransferase-like protein